MFNMLGRTTNEIASPTCLNTRKLVKRSNVKRTKKSNATIIKTIELEFRFLLTLNIGSFPTTTIDYRYYYVVCVTYSRSWVVFGSRAGNQFSARKLDPGILGKLIHREISIISFFWIGKIHLSNKAI